MAAPNVMYHDHTAEDCRHMAREEKIFIYHSAQIPQDRKPESWIVSEPLKPVSRGQTVLWQVVSDRGDPKFSCRTLELDLPANVFHSDSGTVQEDRLHILVNGHRASAEVKEGVDFTVYTYKAKINGKEDVIGNSAPGVIVDPGR